MKFYSPKQVKVFSGRVEVAITPLAQNGSRMSGHDGVERKSLRLEDTTVEGVYRIVYKALEVNSERSK